MPDPPERTYESLRQEMGELLSLAQHPGWQILRGLLDGRIVAQEAVALSVTRSDQERRDAVRERHGMVIARDIVQNRLEELAEHVNLDEEQE